MERNENNEKIGLNEVVSNLYVALTGEQPSEELNKRLQAGSRAMEGLYQLDERASYVALAATLMEVQKYLPTNSPGKEALGHLANYFAGKSSYDFQKEKKIFNYGGK